MGFLTGNNSIDALLAGDSYRWNAGKPTGTATTISYSFLTSLPTYYASGAAEAKDFAAVTDSMKAGIEAALSLYEQVCNVRFVEDTSEKGQITFAQCSLSGVATSSYGGGTGKAGDVFFNINHTPNQSMTAGSYAFMTALHEIGHALGLKHPGNYDGTAGAVPGPYLPAATDSVQYTVMSYYGGL
ncbi:matrixin family metalloprotease [Azospirillum sp. RWY-5-1]|uniref:Matrixin family metalloprotease n=1 Tax=Azospirillum oleiclasticum TaxID=2735135 RepID=A0ABX2T750_9PROT|nr:matrixin family metalloprotease [Azospirillum oleiclasticum]NYZ11942.1 matrixin family metalloprotease [Azospirillum oleiclasticum]NYZ19102.1 matrixin family metalloprotease [Azospirillum oleiclasticum]